MRQTAKKQFRFYSQEVQATNGTSAAELKKKMNGHANGTEEEHDEVQYLDLIRKIMQKGEKREVSWRFQC
jgi:hypothetical protein